MTPLSSRNKARGQVVIVDACVDDYSRLLDLVKGHSIRLTITTTGSGALRLASSFPDALWLVSTSLPDMSGLNLLEMLRSLLPKVTVCVVDAKHDGANEHQALRLSASQYLCKPFQLEWIEAWRGPPSHFLPEEVDQHDLPVHVARKY